MSSEKKMNRCSQMLVAVLFSVAVSSDVCATEIAVADFQDGTTQGWTQGFGGTSVVADAGPDGSGDFAISAVPRSGNRRLFPFNTSTSGFVGDYIANDVVEISFDALVPDDGSGSASVQLHAVILNGGGNRWTSLESAVVPNDGIWRSYTISLREADLAHPLGGNSFATDFANVGQIGLRHQSVANQAGGSAVPSGINEVLLDNIRINAIPEPSTIVLGLSMAGLSLTLRRRQSSRSSGV